MMVLISFGFELVNFTCLGSDARVLCLNMKGEIGRGISGERGRLPKYCCRLAIEQFILLAASALQCHVEPRQLNKRAA